eukprot:550624_1
MSEYSAKITDKCLGVEFDHNNPYTVSHVTNDKWGISIGDTLIKINTVSISQITQCIQMDDIKHILSIQTIPYTVTFKIHSSNDIQIERENIITEISKLNIEAVNNLIASDTPISVSDLTTPSYSITPMSPFSPLLTATNMLNEKELTFDESINKDDTKLEPETIYDSDSDDSDSINTYQLIKKFMLYDEAAKANDYYKYIYFNKGATYNKRVCLLSSKGLKSGYYEWKIKILKCDVFRQEIGVVTNPQIDNIKFSKNGAADMNNFGSRAIYGNELCTNSVYYGSYNSDGLERCYRDLSKDSKIGWITGDIIKVCLNLVNWRIKFCRNGVPVRKAMSLQKNQTYYPMILFSGELCQYKLIKQTKFQ